MKRFISILLALGFLVSCSSDREGILKVYNWSCYIDEDLIGEFEQWYHEQTGETVKVIYQTFDVNETMLSKIELGHEDYDLVCPSEYIIERMLMNDMLLPIERDFGDTPDYISGISQYIRRCFDQIQGYGKNANDYSVGYMWGTAGILYNPRFVSDSEVGSWDVFLNPEYAGKILMKDAFRDAYTSFLIALNKEAIDAGEKTMLEVSMDASDESIELVENYIGKFKDGIAGFEADFGKEQMTKEQAWLSFNWSGDAEWAIKEAARVGVELRYAVPRSGSIVWFDGWVIPKYARNVRAASYFINFMCKPENAIRNMAEIGYVSAVGAAEVLDRKIEEGGEEVIDASYFFGPSADSVRINPVQYPDKAVIAGCGMMHDNGDRTEQLLKMWSRVKGDSASGWTIVVIVAVSLACVAVAVINSRKKLRRHRRKKQARHVSDSEIQN